MTEHAILPAQPTAPCNYCRASITWALTSAGKRMPLDAGPTMNGNVALTYDPEARAWRATVITAWEQASEAWRLAPRHVHHGTTCPRAREWWPSASAGHRRDVAGVHKDAAPSKPDARGAPSGLRPILHPGNARPVQEGLFG